LAVDHLHGRGRRIDPELLAHISPAQSDTIGLFGTITVDIDAELARLDPAGHRPLRNPTTAGQMVGVFPSLFSRAPAGLPPGHPKY
jgi:hypothetical protein